MDARWAEDEARWADHDHVVARYSEGIKVPVTARQVAAIMEVADEAEKTWGHTCLIDSSAAGWNVVVRKSERSMSGSLASLEALCRALASGGSGLAWRIKRSVAAGGVDVSAWPSASPARRKPSQPQGLDAVVLAWRAGKRCRGGNVRTDGNDLYSWDLRIGLTIQGRKVAIDYRGRISGSTTRHCGRAIAAADEVREPSARERLGSPDDAPPVTYAAAATRHLRSLLEGA
jgi:hypothetical protein